MTTQLHKIIIQLNQLNPDEQDTIARLIKEEIDLLIANRAPRVKPSKPASPSLPEPRVKKGKKP